MTPPPSIVQVIGSFQGGGAQRLAINLAQALAAKGHRSLAVAVRHAGAFADKDKPAGVEVHALGASRSSRASVFRAARDLRRLLRASNAGVVHVHGSGCVVVAALAMVGWRRRPRLAFTWHDSGTVVGGSRVSKMLTRWALRRCDALYGSSDDVARRLALAVGGGREVGVFVNAVPEREASTAIDDAMPRMVWMGRLVPVKDPELMLRALATVKAGGHEFQCVLAGSALPHAAAFEAQCRALHESLGLAPHVSMPGWVDDTSGLIGASNIGVQSSQSEGLSMALLEQMMAGLAVVATNVGDTGRAIQDGVSGLLVPPGDPPALAAALTRVVTDGALRGRLGAAARERALSMFSLSAMADRAIAEYRRIGAKV